jgi:hypothetical protein
MKPVVTITLACLMMATFVKAQSTQDVFDPEKKITWLGLDFTAAVFIGDRERFGSAADTRYLLEAWNSLVINEAQKYDIGKAFNKYNVDNAVDITKSRNAEFDISQVYSDNTADHFRLKPSDIPEIVKTYDFKNLHGMGLMFIIESFNKLNNEGAMWITFIDMDSKKVVLTEKMVAPPGGFGLRNYWAGSIYKVLEQIKKREFEVWRKKYYLKR